MLDVSENLDLQTVLSAIGKYLSRIESYTRALNSVVSELAGEVESLRDKVDELSRHVVVIAQHLHALSAHVNKVEERINDLSSEVRDVREDLSNLRAEFHQKVIALENRMIAVERRVSEAEKNLDEHLRKQDEVLRSHSEALLNDLAFQIMSVIRTRYGESVTLTLMQLRRNPLIAIEDHRSIKLLVIAESSSEHLRDTLGMLSDRLERYTDKEVIYRVLTLEMGKMNRRPPSAGEPVWTLLAEESI